MVPRNRSRSSCAEKHDKLGWTCGFSFEVGAETFGVRTNSAELLEQLREELPVGSFTWCDQQDVSTLISFKLGGESTRPGTKHYHLVYRDWTRVERTLELPLAMYAFKRTALENILSVEEPRVQILSPGFCWQQGNDGVAVLGSGYAEMGSRLRQTGNVTSLEFLRFDVGGQVGPCPLRSEGSTNRELLSLRKVFLLTNEQSDRVLSTGEAVVRMFPEARGVDNPKLLMSMLGGILKNVKVVALSKERTESLSTEELMAVCNS